MGLGAVKALTLSSGTAYLNNNGYAAGRLGAEG